jgi:hypothetical protein
MRLFSHRRGLKPYEKKIQHESVDEELRNRLWSLVNIFFWDRWKRDYRYDSRAQEIETLLDKLWFGYFKKPLDTRPYMHDSGYGQKSAYEVLRNYFFTCDWNEVYDFIEFIVAGVSDHLIKRFPDSINTVLVEENSAYRLIQGQFTPITNKEEIAAVEDAMASGLGPVQEHLSAAIGFLSDRKNPDFRNSIKESISAVESLMKLLTKKKSATLSDGLKRITGVVDIHPALLLGFEKLYAYTGDEDGIRHAIFDQTKVTHADAKYFLVSCSAFINYTLEKFSEKQESIK